MNEKIGEDNTKELHTSLIEGLVHDEWIEIHGYANVSIAWKFSTSPSQTINVWLLDSSSYSNFISSGFATGYHLTTSASSSSSFDVSSFIGQTWYVIFWNDVSGSQYTVLTYNVGFYNSHSHSITVTEPTSSSTYLAGKDYVVRWTSINAGTDVKIELFQGSTLISALLPSTVNDGEQRVEIPLSCPVGSNYRIKITSLLNFYFGFSANFTIEIQKYCRVIFPASDEVFELGDVVSIIWETDCQSTEVEIELNSAWNWDYIYYIDLNASNNGFYNWTINGEGLFEKEDGYFIIVRPKYCDANCTFVGFFTIKKNNLLISSYDITIVIWTAIWISIAGIIFIKKKCHFNKFI